MHAILIFVCKNISHIPGGPLELEKINQDLWERCVWYDVSIHVKA